MLHRLLGPADPALASTVFGVRFPGPLGLAAGFDKDGMGLHAWGALGFGYAEVGTVTAHPQPGNPAPRLFRLPDDRALLNRMGFNNHGAGALAVRLARGRPDAPIGVNIGKTKTTPAADAVDDYRDSARLVGPLASYLVVNVSSPNTPGLRDLQAVESLRPILSAVLAEASRTSTPVLVKIAPDISDADVDDIADLAVELGLAGIVATNTTVSRDGLITPAVERAWRRRHFGAAGGAARCRGAAPALRPRRRSFGADQCWRYRDRRRRVGPHHRRRLAAAGIYRLHLRRGLVAQAHSRRHCPPAARGRIRLAAATRSARRRPDPKDHRARSQLVRLQDGRLPVGRLGRVRESVAVGFDVKAAGPTALGALVAAAKHPIEPHLD